MHCNVGYDSSRPLGDFWSETRSIQWKWIRGTSPHLPLSLFSLCLALNCRREGILNRDEIALSVGGRKSRQSLTPRSSDKMREKVTRIISVVNGGIRRERRLKSQSQLRSQPKRRGGGLRKRCHFFTGWMEWMRPEGWISYTEEWDDSSKEEISKSFASFWFMCCWFRDWNGFWLCLCF